MKKKILICIVAVASHAAAQDTTTIELDAVTTTATIIEENISKTARNVQIIGQEIIRNAPVKSIDGILQYAQNVDVRTRSPYGVQADINIRGGGFDQTLILIDGVKMNDPQTGHHNLNLPLAIEDIDRIEILTGGASRVYGPNAFAGAINIITKKPDKSTITAKMSGGNFGLINTELFAYLHTKKNWNIGVSGSAARSDGYATNTSFRKLNHRAFVQKGFKSTALTVQYGWVSSSFEASNFYHPKFFNQSEHIFGILGSFIWDQYWTPKLSSKLIASTKKHYDEFDFDGYRKLYHSSSTSDQSVLPKINFHETKVDDIEWKFKWNHRFGKMAFGANYRYENILSNRLGYPIHPKRVWDYSAYPTYYTKYTSRTNWSLFFEENIAWKKWILNAGTLVNTNSKFGTAWYPGLDISYQISPLHTLYTSLNRSLRYPTFTELFLQTTALKANPNTLPEKAWSVELGYKNANKNSQKTLALYHRATTDAIDKALFFDRDIPEIVNIDHVNFWGAECQWQYHFRNPKHLKNAFANYGFQFADLKEPGYQSFYTLNYLRHKASVGVNLDIVPKLDIGLIYTLKDRAGHYENLNNVKQSYDLVHLLDLKANYTLKKINFFVDLNNLLNLKYYDFGLVEQPRLWWSAGLRYSSF